MQEVYKTDKTIDSTILDIAVTVPAQYRQYYLINVRGKHLNGTSCSVESASCNIK